MKRTTIAPAFLLVSALLVGSLSACTQPNTSEATQPETTAANPVSSTSKPKADSASSQAAEPVAAATTPGSSREPKADSASSQAAEPVEVAANPASSTQPKANSAERAKKRAEVRKQIDVVLKPEQVKQLNAKLKGGEKMRKALSEINLTAEQKTKIKAILKAAYPNVQKPSETKPQ
jgi:Spy/CpxP family protein refolding chaperone